jgi:DNA repair exonuclease SbcCD nuclease subunit
MSSSLDFVRNNRDVKFILMSGNHDMSSRTGEGVSALKAFDMEPNVKTIHKTMTSKKEGITFVPWDPANMIQDIKKSETPYIISHLGLNEAKLNSGISIISEIGLKDVSKFEKIFLDHYHKPQEVENAIYVGSIIQEDWGERDDEKRFIVFDTETGNTESIPTTGYRKYFKLTLDKGNKDSVIEQAKKYLEEGHEVKISKIESVDTSEIDNIMKVVDDIELDITNRGITSDMTLVDMMSKYLEIKDIPKESVEDYMVIGKSLIDTYDKKVAGGKNVLENNTIS